MMRECEYCGATLDPQEVCDCRSTSDDAEIVLWHVTPPVISENFTAVTAYIDDTLTQLSTLPRTKEGCATAKALRADLRRRLEYLEDQRKAAKTAILEPYNAKEEVYKEKISTPLTTADQKLKSWIDSYQDEVKQNCRDELQSYFDELCAVLHIDFVTFGQTGVVVDMATANLKDPKKARNTIHDFLNRIEEDRRTISAMEHADEIMAEYKLSLSLSAAIAAVNDRHERIAQASADMEMARPKADKKHSPSTILFPPIIAPDEEPVLRCTFTVNATRNQLRKIREFLTQEGIQFE